MTVDQKSLAAAIKSNLIDRVINYCDPVLGQKRLQARAMMALSGSYIGASRSRNSMKSWFTSSQDADADLIPDLPLLRSRSRDLIRNQPLATGAIGTNVITVIGTGLRLQSEIDRDFLGMEEQEADAWQQHTEREFKLWANSLNCDLTQHANFCNLQDLAFRSMLENGDVLVNLPMDQTQENPYSTRIQLIEADRICNKDNKRDNAKLVAGVALNSAGAAQAYHVLNRHPNSLPFGKKKWVVMPAQNSHGLQRTWLLYDRLRVHQNRGAPYLAPVIEPLKQLGRYTDAELMAAVISGMFTVFVKSEAGDTSLLGANDLDGDTKPDRSTYELGNGLIIEGIPGDGIEVINPGRPNDSFDPFVQAVLRQIGVALEMPFEILIKHFTASFSASKAAILEAWRAFRRRRLFMARYFCQPIYAAWMAEAVSLGRISAPGFFDDPLIRQAYLGSTWQGDGQGSINPANESSAAGTRLALGITTLADEIANYDGGDPDSKHKRRVHERRAAERDGLLAPPPTAAPPDPNNPAQKPAT